MPVSLAFPAGVETNCPIFGNCPLTSRYSSCSKARQQRRRPHTPDILAGLRGTSCSLAIRIEIEGKLVSQER
ncbi:MAG: hypothetical protein MUP86_03275, partial [Dehalococcoidia bacterium]|nr:hypothetical protein [Dehalococcoidia bacterium]